MHPKRLWTESSVLQIPLRPSHALTHMPKSTLRPQASPLNTTANTCSLCASSDSSISSIEPPPSFIQFLHPGYEDDRNWMFRLPAFDRHHQHKRPTSRQDQWGVHHGTALRACSVIACNIDGFLSPTRLSTTSPLPSILPLDDLLIAPQYYFYPSSWEGVWGGGRRIIDLKYPVCPGFQHWRFPHDSIPHEWMLCYVSFLPPSSIPNGTDPTRSPDRICPKK